MTLSIEKSQIRLHIESMEEKKQNKNLINWY